jgi:hypothetical protein
MASRAFAFPGASKSHLCYPQALEEFWADRSERVPGCLLPKRQRHTPFFLIFQCLYSILDLHGLDNSLSNSISDNATKEAAAK